MPAPAELVLSGPRRFALTVLDLGLACCAVEFVAAAVREGGRQLAGALPLASGPQEAQVLVVSGTVTDALAPAVLEVWERMPEPKHCVSVGACANSGGPYWDSYSVTKGVDQLVPVDVWVPGCPPRPEAVIDGLLALQDAAAPVDTAPADRALTGGPSVGAGPAAAAAVPWRPPAGGLVGPPGGVRGPEDLRRVRPS